MTEPKSGKTVSPDELLEIRERQWRPRAEAVSLAAETLDLIPVDRREQALRAFGRLHNRLGPGSARERLLRRYPAVHVLATAGVAAEHYQKATFWPKLIAILGIQPDPAFQSAWGDAFLDNLRRLGLPTFDKDDGAGSRYVGRILLHSGMPTYCLADFFRILSWKRSQTPGLSPEEFISWASAKSAGPGFQSLDMPVQRFLLYGDEFAVDVADRSFELLDAVAIGAPHDEVLLPKRFWGVAQKLHERNVLARSANDGTASSANTDLRPRLVLDPNGLGLLLRLPPVGDAPDGKAVWVVTLDEQVQRVATESLWPGSSEPAPQTDVQISRPVRSASVALAGREHLQLPFVVVDDQDPLLAFGDDCELISKGLPLPAAKVWMLFPGDPESLEATGPIRITSESPLPPRWSGFSLLQVDLSEAAAVSIRGSARTVRRLESARIETSDPVAGIRTASSLPVLPEVPRIVIPKSLANADWDVALHDGGGYLVARKQIAGAEDPNTLWEAVRRPLVGTFTLRVRGPWGRGATRSFTLIESLSVTSTPGWRRFVTAGLQQCATKLRAAKNIEFSCEQVALGERDREQRVRIGVGGELYSFVISPPHMTVAYQADDFSINPTIRPLTLLREDLSENPGELIIDIGASAQPTLHVISGGRTIQKLSPHSARVGIYRFNLAEIVDTLRAHPQVVLALSEEGELVVATLRPRTLFTGIELNDTEFKLENCVAVDGLSAYLFATRAPWREPACVPVIDGRVTLPPWLIDAGPIRVMVRIEDPWVPLPAPNWPQPGESRVVEAAGWITEGDAEEIAVSKFLAGDLSDPVEVIDFVRLWTARALLPALSLGTRIADIAAAIDTEVYANPSAALAALNSSEAPGESIPSLMIRSGLAWANLADAHEASTPPWTMRGALPAALLSAADSLWSDEEIEAATSVCGDSVTGILDGADPYANAGIIDEAAERLDQNPALREQFIHAARLVPQGLLSADSRVLATMDLVAQRRDPRLEWLIRNARGVLREGERLIRMIGHKASQQAFDARRHPNRVEGWQVFPSISMALAIAARHAARGHAEAAKWMPRERRVWESLAAVAPQLVTVDLIIAELTVGRRLEPLFEEGGEPQ